MRTEANRAKAAQSNATMASMAIEAAISGWLLLKYNYH
jgi:hypothetical protein